MSRERCWRLRIAGDSRTRNEPGAAHRLAPSGLVRMFRSYPGFADTPRAIVWRPCRGFRPAEEARKRTIYGEGMPTRHVNAQDGGEGKPKRHANDQTAAKARPKKHANAQGGEGGRDVGPPQAQVPQGRQNPAPGESSNPGTKPPQSTKPQGGGRRNPPGLQARRRSTSTTRRRRQADEARECTRGRRRPGRRPTTGASPAGTAESSPG